MSSEQNYDQVFGDLFDQAREILCELRQKTSVDYTGPVSQLSEQVSAISAKVDASTANMSKARNAHEQDKGRFWGDISKEFKSAAEKFIKPYVDKDPLAPVIRQDYGSAVSVSLGAMACAFLIGVGIGFPLTDWCRSQGLLKQPLWSVEQEAASNWASKLSPDEHKAVEWALSDAGVYARKFDAQNQGSGGIQGIGRCTGNDTRAPHIQGNRQVCTISFWQVQ